jgi:hypothetical protein
MSLRYGRDLSAGNRVVGVQKPSRPSCSRRQILRHPPGATSTRNGPWRERMSMSVTNDTGNRRLERPIHVLSPGQPSS